MKTLTLLTLLISLGSAASASAQEAPIDPREAELERLARDSPKLHLKGLLDYHLEKLGAIYQVTLEKAEDESQRQAIEASQKAWLKFFAADGVAAGWNAKGGSGAYAAQLEQKIYLVRSRCYQLSTPFLQGWPAVPRVPYPAG